MILTVMKVAYDFCEVCLFGLVLYVPVNSFGHVLMVS